MMGSKAFESPLISHERMRAMFRGLVEVRALAGRSAPTKGLEACWVAAAIDLQPGDLTSASPAQTWLVEHLRRLGIRPGAKAASTADIRQSLLEVRASRGKSGLKPFDRMLCAVGSAMALAAAGAKGVEVAFAGQADLTPAEWQRVFEAAEAGKAPMVIVALPGGAKQVDLGAIAKRAGGVPVIPVDAGDVVALYRVAQESIVRARADRQLAVMECVACGVDPVKLMGGQLVKKKICTEKWVAAVETGFRGLLGKV